MSTILSGLIRFVEFIIAFGLLVFLHEFGHYLVSKLFHIQVEEFGFGFPPRLVRLFKFHETEFTLNWIPFGAFVRPKGENDPKVPGGLAAANPWARLSVLLGGPLMNILTGILLFSLVFVNIGVPDYRTVQVVDVSQGSPAEMAGIKPEDIITQINGQPVHSTEELSATVLKSVGSEITITLQRGSQTLTVQAVPRKNPPKGQGALGIGMSNPLQKTSWIGALPASLQTAYEQVHQLITLPGMILSGRVSASEARPVGPKGIYDIFSSAQQRDQQAASAAQEPEPILGLNTLYFLAVISVALGITNLLPIPALDGGRILFVLPEILLRRRVPAEYENMIHLIGFAALILLMIYITTQDFINPVVIP